MATPLLLRIVILFLSLVNMVTFSPEGSDFQWAGRPHANVLFTGTPKVPTGILSCGRCCRELRVGFDMISHSQRLIKTWGAGWWGTGVGSACHTSSCILTTVSPLTQSALLQSDVLWLKQKGYFKQCEPLQGKAGAISDSLLHSQCPAQGLDHSFMCFFSKMLIEDLPCSRYWWGCSDEQGIFMIPDSIDLAFYLGQQIIIRLQHHIRQGIQQRPLKHG